MTTTIWTLLFIFIIAPLGALAFDWSLFGNWIWHIAPEKVRDYEPAGTSKKGIGGAGENNPTDLALAHSSTGATKLI